MCIRDRSKTKPDSEKKDTAAPSTATMKEGLPLKGVDIHEEGMSLTLEEADLQAIGEKDRGFFTIHEAPWDARTEGPREELDLDPELRRSLENDAGQGEQQDADSNAAHSRDLSAENNSADIDQLEVDGSTRYPDSVLETHAATADGASSYCGVGPACWDWQPYNGWNWSWSYGDEVPNSLPTPSGTSAATAHTLDDVPFDNLPIKHGVRMVPLRKEQIRYIYKEDGTWKLNSKISPIPNIPEQWQFKGYFWGPDDSQAYAYFTHMHAGGPGTRRRRPRGGANQSWYADHYRTKRLQHRGDGWKTYPS